MGIGNKLQALLDARNKKAGTLASETGISKNTIYGIIKRDNRKVDLSILQAIADNLGVSVDYFFDEGAPAISPVLSPDESILLEGYRSLSQQGKEYIQQTLVMAMNTYKKIDCVSVVEGKEA